MMMLMSLESTTTKEPGTSRTPTKPNQKLGPVSEQAIEKSSNNY